ncbi:MAG: hypothetical protein Q4C61_17315 [Lachnospiraceae bacterium]|nr:hypothetical protein [Lachnospiraceae bacterium]
MKALEYLQQKELLHIGMLQVLLRGTAEVYQEGENGVFLRDTVSGAWMLSTEDVQTGIRWLREKTDAEYRLMQLCQREIADFAQKEYELTTRLECRQAVYRGAEPPSYAGRLAICEAGEPELKKIRANYDKLSDEELKEIQKAGNLFAGYFENQFVGFIGSHLEGSMGLLEILPEYRRQSFGEELEAFMIGHMMRKGLIPFGQIEIWNEKSLGLQKKLRMELSDESDLVYWIF